VVTKNNSLFGSKVNVGTDPAVRRERFELLRPVPTSGVRRLGITSSPRSHFGSNRTPVDHGTELGECFRNLLRGLWRGSSSVRVCLLPEGYFFWSIGSRCRPIPEKRQDSERSAEPRKLSRWRCIRNHGRPSRSQRSSRSRIVRWKARSEQDRIARLLAFEDHNVDAQIDAARS
jgi:hypothetical protein